MMSSLPVKTPAAQNRASTEPWAGRSADPGVRCSFLLVLLVLSGDPDRSGSLSRDLVLSRSDLFRELNKVLELDLCDSESGSKPSDPFQL